MGRLRNPQKQYQPFLDVALWHYLSVELASDSISTVSGMGSVFVAFAV